ncbi:MAG: M1 family aminopeptidase, partial [Cyclobacteriaceae bacterium]|nr:M1 family aminopeptidase [Cyclobacteriaceae bacterium]
FVSYDLKFSIPDNKQDLIVGYEKIGVKLKSNLEPLVIDFKTISLESIRSLKINGNETEFELTNGHIVLPSKKLKIGYNEIDIDFVSGDQSLNRSEDFMYSLFVPDRASTAFPCFDQPDLKAKYKLELEIPTSWIAMSNGPLLSELIKTERKQLKFEETDLISTYLFSFVAGKFQSVKRSIEGFEMTMIHRETDTTKVNNNVDEIFQQHYDAIKWLEDYTDIKYPYKKFDFALIPSFQYGGMEHTGAIQYRDSRLLLDEPATLDDKISRTMLIAHESAHMWFGNLVTMQWFNDVWMKEVFANFMASKITESKFIDINHKLNFLFSHYPQAYAVDRTEGTNAIKQELKNLKNAGSMYGAIIYHKAPIVMRQLELLMGEAGFRESLREYLVNYSGKNATWEDLVEIMDRKSEKDVKVWSKAWIDEPGMPFFDIEFLENENIRRFDIRQYDLDGKNRIWPQKFNITFGYLGNSVNYSVNSNDRFFSIPKSPDTEMPIFIQMNSDGLGYGIFSNGLDYIKEDFMFNRGLVDIPYVTNDLNRGAAYLMLQEFLLHEGMNPMLYLKYLEDYITIEENELILTYLLKNLELIYWKFLTTEQNEAMAQEVESMLTQKISSATNPEIKHLLFKSFISITRSERGIMNLMNFWTKASTPLGMEITEDEFILMAYHIQLKSNQIAETVADQIERLDNTDRKDEMKFIGQALDLNESKREDFFNSLLHADNRTKESWVNQALYFLNHPIRAKTSIKFLKPALEELEQIQITGDIFFPKNWLDNTLWGYNSSEAVGIINEYLESHQHIDPKLRQKVLQSSDMVFRAEKVISDFSTAQ